MKNGKKSKVTQEYRVFVTREYGEEEDPKTYWIRVGTAFQYESGAIVVLLDALHKDGKLTLLPPQDTEENEDEDDLQPRRKRK